MGFFSSIGNAFLGKGGDVYSGIGSAMNKLTGAESMNEKTYKQQIASMQLQNAYNKNMWYLQNDYNSPSAQLARMADAGIEINPTSYALGNGNLSNTAGLVGSSSGFAGNGSPAGNPITMAMGVAQGITGARESVARTELDKTQNAILRHNLKLARDTNTPVGQQESVVTASKNAIDNIVDGITEGKGPISHVAKRIYDSSSKWSIWNNVGDFIWKAKNYLTGNSDRNKILK